MALFEVLESYKEMLSGREATSEEIKILESKFVDFPMLTELLHMVNRFKLIGQSFQIPDADNLSGIQVDMEWMAPQKQIDEAFHYYPGIIASKQQYIPVGNCLSGSGDPYFIKYEGGEWILYRVIHDVATDDVFTDEMLEYIMPLEKAFRYLIK